jgi:ATP-binding cassette, subfamily B, multidrug efflux pump
MSAEQTVTRPQAGKRPSMHTAIRGARRGGGPQMSIPPEKPKDFRKAVRRLSGYLRPYTGQLAAVFLLAALSTLFTILSPKILGNAITLLFQMFMQARGEAVQPSDFSAVTRLLIILALLYGLSSLFSFLMQYIMASTAQEAVYTLRRKVKERLNLLPLTFFDSRSHGEVLSRVTNDIDLISTSLQQTLTQIITSAVSLAGITVMMLTISPVLTIVTILTLPLNILVIKGVVKRSQKYFSEQQTILGSLNGHIEEMFSGHREVKAFCREEASAAVFAEKNEALYRAGWKAQFISGVIMPLMIAVNNIGYVIISVAGALFALRRVIEIGDIQAFVQYSRQFSQPVQQTANIANMIQSAAAAAERVFELMDSEPEEPDPQYPVVPNHPAGAISIEHLHFSYDPKRPLITDLNLEIPSGASIAVVGPTGAGKTTLVNLLMRFYESGGGSISIDGTDIRAMRRGDLRTMFAMVLQDTWLFSGTIRENIAFARDDASLEEITAVARAAHADHFIRTLPEGYDTMINEDASNLSHGQKQLITIARAFLADPVILLFDEATSSVDTRTELYVQKAMAALMRGRTNIIIAHRLSTIRDADTILVMNDGAIVETGTHRQLLERGGFYAELYESQFAGLEI